jgi:hypothetical protein
MARSKPPSKTARAAVPRANGKREESQKLAALGRHRAWSRSRPAEVVPA